MVGAEECGEMEEWFNYRMTRAAPDVCAKFLGTFTADITKGQFTAGGKWLIWMYEVSACPSILFGLFSSTCITEITEIETEHGWKNFLL